MGFETFTRQNIFFFARARLFNFCAVMLLLTMTAFAETSDLAEIKSSDGKRKYAALENLAKSPSPAVAANLVAVALQEKDVRFTLALLDQIGATHEQRVIPQLAPMLQKKNIVVRKRAVQVTGLLGGALAERALLDALRQEKDSDVTDAILQALSLCGSEQSVDAIQSYLKSSRPASRANAVQALGRIPGERSAKALEAARSDRDETIRRMAQESVRRRSKNK